MNSQTKKVTVHVVKEINSTLY